MSYLLIAWTWLKGLFASKAAGTIFKIVFSNVTSNTVTLLSNADFQKFAYNTAVELHNDTSKTVLDKAKDFNIKMAQYILSKGMPSSTSLVNVLRELACQAINVKVENGEPVTAIA